MKTPDKNEEHNTPEQSYREAGVEGNDQNAALRKARESSSEDTLGNAEQSERGKDEFLIDQGIEREQDEPSEGHAPKHSERAKREFEEDDQELHKGIDS